VTQSSNHIDDDTLSGLVDNQLSRDEAAHVRAHLESCSTCLERSEGFRSLVELLHGLPQIEPPRDFQLGPRIVADSPNVIHLRRGYAATRVAAASLAAVFVFLTAGSLYIDSRPAAVPASSAVDAAQSQLVSAPSPAAQNAAPAAPKAAAAPRQVSPAPAAGAAAAARPAQSNPETDDQVAAATSVNPLPTPVPTPTPVPLTRSLPVAQVQAAAPSDSAAPLRTSAVICGLLAVLALMAALVARHRLQGQTHP